MIAGIFFYGIAGAAVTALSCTRPNQKRFFGAGMFLLIAAAAGFLGAGIPSLLYYRSMRAEGSTDTLYQLLFFSLLAAVLICMLVTGASILSDRRRLIRPVAVLVPFLWGIFLQLGIWIGGTLEQDPGPILALGISLCSLLLLCPGVAFLRAAFLLKRPHAIEPILAEQARRQKKKEAGRALRQKRQRLRSPRKRSGTK